MTIEPCDVCRTAGSMRPVLQVSLLGLFDAWIQRCDRCGFRQIRPRITASELRLLYPDDYFAPGSAVGFADYPRERQRNERDAFFLSRTLRSFRPRGELLDVGCALGFLIDPLRRYCDWNVRGIDVSSFAAYFARRKFGLDVTAGTLEEAGLPDGSFDFVIQKDLLEHVRDPRAHLAETARILRPGGRVWLVTPNGEANLRGLGRDARELSGRPGNRLPRLDQGHLQFFTRQNLETLFAESGFRLLRMRSVAVRRGLRALGYLPRRHRGIREAPPGHRRGLPETAAPAVPGAPVGDSGVYDLLSAAVDRRCSRVRGSVPYFHFRNLVNALDTLPARLPLGNDFSCHLEKGG
jgi:2-polyprenyl-3-methyl-5-hydroxy-6-metoxy-1,4-benzoquinol methylase